jgi:trans-aconitate methyltransferase
MGRGISFQDVRFHSIYQEKNLKRRIRDILRIKESGVNLYTLQKLYDVGRVGGLDYSQSLTDTARDVVVSDDLRCCEAIDLDVTPKYDVVYSDSGFQYFQDADYGMRVLNKMWEKANKPENHAYWNNQFVFDFFMYR